MRLFTLLLILANTALFAWARYAPALGTVESHLVNQQINPGAIRLVGPAETAKPGATRSEPREVLACMEWGAFSVPEFKRAQAALEELSPGLRIEERHVDEASGWWVFMPPQATRQAAIQKVGELKRLGVQDYFVVQEDPKLRFAISLGVFRTEEAARGRLDQLREQGVKTALVGPRKTPVQKVFLQLRDVPGTLQSGLAALRDGFPATELKRCPDAVAG